MTLLSGFSRLLLVLLVLAIAPAPTAEAQQFGRVAEIENLGVRYFAFTLPGRPSTQVQLWGDVAQPGVYEVEVNTDLAKLLTLAGGTPRTVQDPRDRALTTIQLVRGEDGRRQIVYESSYEEFIMNPNYPQLRDGDYVVVDTRIRRGWRWQDTVQVVSAVGTLTSVGLTLYNILR